MEHTRTKFGNILQIVKTGTNQWFEMIFQYKTWTKGYPKISNWKFNQSNSWGSSLSLLLFFLLLRFFLHFSWRKLLVIQLLIESRHYSIMCSYNCIISITTIRTILKRWQNWTKKEQVEQKQQWAQNRTLWNAKMNTTGIVSVHRCSQEVQLWERIVASIALWNP